MCSAISAVRVADTCQSIQARQGGDRAHRNNGPRVQPSVCGTCRSVLSVRSRCLCAIRRGEPGSPGAQTHNPTTPPRSGFCHCVARVTVRTSASPRSSCPCGPGQPCWGESTRGSLSLWGNLQESRDQAMPASAETGHVQGTGGGVCTRVRVGPVALYCLRNRAHC